MWQNDDGKEDFAFRIRYVVTGQAHGFYLTLLHSEQPKLYRVLAVLSAKGLKNMLWCKRVEEYVVVQNGERVCFGCSICNNLCIQDSLKRYKRLSRNSLFSCPLSSIKLIRGHTFCQAVSYMFIACLLVGVLEMNTFVWI